MELIVSHIGADFDAVASMLAARLLHPDAQLFFPGSREESVRRMLEERPLELRELKRKEIDPAALRRLILCDTRQRDRLGIVADWLAENPRIEVVAYDHHPDSAEDVPHSSGLVDPSVGATATLMTEELRRRRIAPSVDEATALLLGLYEDTGSLTYATTSARDFAAAAWLLEVGGELAAVRRFAARRLDAERIEVLHDMISNLSIERVRGHRIGFVTLELGRHVEELAPLVSRCLELHDLAALFALFGEGERVTVIARGSVDGLDLGALLADAVAGGGHATAAAASVHGATLVECRERLLAGLAEALPPAARARDLMIAPILRLPAGISVAAAKVQLNAWRVNAAPVSEPVTAAAGEDVPPGSARSLPGDLPVGALSLRGTPIDQKEPSSGGPPVGGEDTHGQVARKTLQGESQFGDAPIAGIVTRQMLDGALQHGLGERAVETVMSRDLQWVAPEADAEAVVAEMTGPLPRLLLVGDQRQRRAQGVLTRMAVLRHLQGQMAAAAASTVDRRASGGGVGRQRIGALLRERVGEQTAARLATAAAVSAECGMPVYAVGGFVRDLLLGQENRDLDLVVEGDGLEFARRLAAALGGHAHEHPAFLTAVVVDRDGRHLDVATARSEFYRAPAALPEVQTSALRQDLYRRDFTVNTLAIRLGPKGEPELLDFFGGKRDLEAKSLRLLHSLSLLDDPTRALRAVRLEQRLGLRISEETERLIRIALQERVFDRLSGARLAEELCLLFENPSAVLRTMERLDELHLLAVIHPELTLTPELAARLQEAVAACDWYRLEGLVDPEISCWRLLLGALALGLPGAEQRAQLAGRLALGHRRAAELRDLPERLARAQQHLRQAGLLPHQASAALRGLSGEDLLLLLAGGDEDCRRWVRRELVEMRRFSLAVGGADLLRAGFAPGPAIGAALRATRDARLDGELRSDEEEAHAVAWLQSRPHRPDAASTASAAGDAGTGGDQEAAVVVGETS